MTFRRSSVSTALRGVLLALLLAGPAHAVTCVDWGNPALAGIAPANPDADYQDHEDGTVTHLPTGLMWKKCSEGQTWDGVDNTCSAANTTTTHTWSEALGIAEASGFAGHTDWRLPNVNELHSLVETCRTSPAINDTLFPNTPPSGLFWSASPHAGYTSYAWLVDFGDGYADYSYSYREVSFWVRLVRGGQSFASFDSRLDYTPVALGDFAAVTNATANTVTPSTDSKTLAGLTTVTGIRIEGEGSPEYRVKRNGDVDFEAWTGLPGVVGNGDEIEVGLTAGAAGSTRTATLTVGGVAAAFGVSVPHVVTPSAGANGSLDPATAQNVHHGETTSFTVVPDEGYAIDEVTGCDGSLDGNLYTTGEITGDCTVEASFVPRTSLDLTLPAGPQFGQPLEVALSDSGDWRLAEAAAQSESTIAEAPPPGVQLPHGVVGLRLVGGEPGSSATVVLTYPEAFPPDTRYWKYGRTEDNTTPHWYEFAGAVIAGNTITLTLTDGGAGDDDLLDNGEIIDPGGPGLQPLSHGEATPIPTLSQWMLAALALGLALVAVGRRRWS